MKILIFGTGTYYLHYKKYTMGEEIVALVDNDTVKWGKKLDGHRIIAPSEIGNYEYDQIYLCSLLYTKEMKEQLLKLGIGEEKIRYVFELPADRADPWRVYHAQRGEREQRIAVRESIAGARETGTEKWTDGKERMAGERIVMISHDLTVTGAPNCLLYAAEIYVRQGYCLTVGAPEDGPMRECFLAAGADVIIDERLRMGRLKDMEWAQGAGLLFVNTVQLFYLLLERNLSVPVIWWLHEPQSLYHNVVPERVCAIPTGHLKVVTVSGVAESAFRAVCPSFPVKRLMFGLPDREIGNEKKRCCTFLLIGGVCALKGQDILLNAVSDLTSEEVAVCEFWLVGEADTRYAASLREISERLHLPVRFFGALPHEETLRMIQEADVLVCASRQETVSMVVIEAMMYGKPTVVSSGAGIAEYMRDGKDGLIFATENAEELRKKLRYCLTHRDVLREIGRRARGIYERCFSMRQFEAGLAEIMDEMRE